MKNKLYIVLGQEDWQGDTFMGVFSSRALAQAAIDGYIADPNNIQFDLMKIEEKDLDSAIDC